MISVSGGCAGSEGNAAASSRREHNRTGSVFMGARYCAEVLRTVMTQCPSKAGGSDCRRTARLQALRKPRSLLPKLPSSGKIAFSAALSVTPIQRASVAAYWSTAVVGRYWPRDRLHS